MKGCETVEALEVTARDFGSIRNCGPFRRSALKDYVKKMSQPNEHVLYDGFTAAVLLKQGISWKHEPRSIYDPEQLYTALSVYGEPAQCETGTPSLERAFRLAYRIFAKRENQPTLTTLTDDEVFTEALDLNKSSGLPNLTSKAKDLPYAIDRELQVRKREKGPNPCIAFARTQAGGKTRLVWGYPLEMTIMESRFAVPLINEFLSRRTPYAIGLYKFELGAYVDQQVIDKGTPVGLDYSKFDSTIPASLIKMAFDILGTWFSEEEKVECGWETLVHYFIHTPIVMPDGNLYKGKHHGVPSGSFFTSMVDSVVNFILLMACLPDVGANPHWKSIFIMGDDSIFPVDGDIDLEALAQSLKRFNIRMNVEKTEVGTAHFLGAYWIRCKPTLPLEQLASKAVYTERFRKYNPSLPVERQARAVLASYAACYESGWDMVNKQDRFIFRQLQDLLSVSEPNNTLTGSDEYHEKQIARHWDPNRTARDAELHWRFMM